MQLLTMWTFIIEKHSDDIVCVRRTDQRHSVGIDGELVSLRLAALIDSRNRYDDLAGRQYTSQNQTNRCLAGLLRRADRDNQKTLRRYLRQKVQKFTRRIGACPVAPCDYRKLVFGTEGIQVFWPQNAMSSKSTIAGEYGLVRPCPAVFYCCGVCFRYDDLRRPFSLGCQAGI